MLGEQYLLMELYLLMAQYPHFMDRKIHIFMSTPILSADEHLD